MNDFTGSEHIPLKVPNVKFDFGACAEAQTLKSLMSKI